VLSMPGRLQAVPDRFRPKGATSIGITSAYDATKFMLDESPDATVTGLKLGQHSFKLTVSGRTKLARLKRREKWKS